MFYSAASERPTASEEGAHAGGLQFPPRTVVVTRNGRAAGKRRGPLGIRCRRGGSPPLARLRSSSSERRCRGVYVTRRNGTQAGALRLPDGSEATTQKRSRRLRSRLASCHRTSACRVPIL